MDKLSFFNEELAQIKRRDIKKFTQMGIEILPEYFFIIPASSTGKYHPSYALGEGGLVRHTKVAVRIALMLFENRTIQDFTEDEKDMIISALILHDGVKSGIPKQTYTLITHPLEVVKLIMSKQEIMNCVGKETSTTILRAVVTHMGQWNYDYKTREKVLPTPENKIERFVHMCDYLSSRKALEFNFDAPLSRR